MKTFKFMSVVVILGGILVSGCGAVKPGKAMSNVDSLAGEALVQAAAPAISSTEAPLLLDVKSNEATGVVQSITDTSITIGGQTYTFAPGAEIKGTVTAGTFVKLHFITNADGSLSIREVEIVDPTQINAGAIDDNPGTQDLNDDNSNSINVGDDSTSTHDINDDHSNDSQSTHQSKDNKGSDNHGSGGHSGDDNSGSGHG